MGNSRLIKLALVLGRCKLIAGEESDAYNNGDYMDYVPYVSRFAYHALVEFRHKHYPVPKLIEFRWRFPYALTPHRLRLRVAEMLHRIDKTVRRLYVWRPDCPCCGDAMYDSFDTSEDLWGNQCSYRVTVCPTCGDVGPKNGGAVTDGDSREALLDPRYSSPSSGDLPCPPDPYQRPEDQYVIPDHGFESSKNDEVSS